MPVTLSFGNHQNYTLNESRLAHLLSADKEKALHMGGWDKVQDHFRTKKKTMCWKCYTPSFTGRAVVNLERWKLT